MQQTPNPLAQDPADVPPFVEHSELECKNSILKSYIHQLHNFEIAAIVAKLLESGNQQMS